MTQQVIRAGDRVVFEGLNGPDFFKVADQVIRAIDLCVEPRQ